MSQYAVITIELPLDGREQADAQALADYIARRTLTTNLHDLEHSNALLYGRVTNVRLTNREA